MSMHLYLLVGGELPLEFFSWQMVFTASRRRATCQARITKLKITAGQKLIKQNHAQ